MRQLLTKEIAAGVFLMLLPFFILPVAADMPTQFDLPKLMGVFLAGNLILACALARVDFIFSVIHGGIAVSTILTGFGSPQLYFYAYWTAGVIFAAWFVGLSRIERERILGFVVAGGVLVAAHCYVQILWTDPILQYAPGIDHHLPIAFLRQHTLMGAFLAPVACLALAMRYQKCFYFMLPILFFAHSNFTLLALGAGVSVVVLDRYGSAALCLLGAAGVALLIGLMVFRPNTFFSHGRVDVWRESLTWWWSHARWLGRGAGSFRVLYPPHIDQFGNLIPHTGIQGEQLYSHGAFLQTHNDYIQVAFDFGLMGLSVLAFTLLGVFQAFWNSFQWRDRPKDWLGCQAMLLALMANAFGNFPFQLAPHFLLGLISLAMVLHADDL